MTPKLNLKDYKNYLILQTAFIGDVALSLFFVEALKKINPEANINFITTNTSFELVKSSKSVNNAIIFDKRKSHKKISQIKIFANEFNQKYKTDVAFILHKSLRSAILTRFISSKYKIGFDKNALSFLLSRRVKYYKNMHEIDRNMQLLSAFSEYNSNINYILRPEIDFTEISNSDSNIISNNTILKHINPNIEKNIIAVSIGSAWETKKWKYEYFLETISRLKKNNYEVVLIGDKSDQRDCENIAASTNSISLAGKTTIPETLQLLKFAKLLITNDSAPTHFASILNIPTITIFGPTSPIFGFYPIADNSKIVEDINLSCRPCSIHGGKTCPKKTHDCMNNITPEQVLSAVEDIIKKTT